MSKKLMISAGESSGELYGAMLSSEVRKKWPDTEIFGIGGSHMKKEGVELIARPSGALGLIEVFSHINEIWGNYSKAKKALLTKRPDILVLIDYPDFNIALAKKAKAAGIPILYYVSPQVWAWRSGRVKKIAALVNRIAVLFPFEVRYYEASGLPCEFVGHPVAESINITGSKENLKHELGLDPNKPVIALLPGSRPSEMQRHMPLLKEVAAKIHSELPDYQIIIPLANDAELQEELKDYMKVVKNRTREAVACADAAAVASGTATFETALLGTPMVVYYRMSPLSFHLIKMMTMIKYISLVNILSEKDVVRELLQNDANAESISSELKRILGDIPYRDRMISELRKIKNVMQDKKPSERVASIIGEIAGWDSSNA